MNKLTIPAILAATVMVAGMFAFMPVQQASTVHTSGTAVVTIADGDIDADAIAADAITAAKIEASAIGASEIADNAITAAKINADAITEAKIADDAIAAEHLADNAITRTANQAVARADFNLSCSISELLQLGAAGESGQIDCSVFNAEGGLVAFDALTVTVVEQLDDGGITAAAAAEIGSTDRFNIDLDDAAANAAGERWCGTVSVTDGTSTAEQNLCTSRIT